MAISLPLTGTPTILPHPKDPTAGLGAPNWFGHPAPEKSLDALVAIAEQKYHLIVTATKGGGHVGGSLHNVGAGEAVDLSGSAANMNAFAKWAQTNLGGKLLELIHNDGGNGYAVKNGKLVHGPSFYSAVWAGHRNHVHIAVGPDFKIPDTIVGPGAGLGQGAADVGSGVAGAVDSAGQLLSAFKWIFSGEGLLTITLVGGGGVMAVLGLARMFGVRAPIAAVAKMAAKV